MFVLVRNLGSHYDPYIRNVAVSRDQSALETAKEEDRKNLERLKQEHFQKQEIIDEYHARYKELGEANPFPKPKPLGAPKCKKPPVTRDEHEARAQLKVEVSKSLNKWIEEADKHFRPYYQQAKAEIIKAHNLPDDFDLEYQYTPDWMYEDTIDARYRIEKVKEV